MRGAKGEVPEEAKNNNIGQPSRTTVQPTKTEPIKKLRTGYNQSHGNKVRYTVGSRGAKPFTRVVATSYIPLIVG